MTEITSKTTPVQIFVSSTLGVNNNTSPCIIKIQPCGHKHEVNQRRNTDERCAYQQHACTAAARFLDVTINDIDGYLFSSSPGTEYYFTENVGLGASLAWFDLRVRHNGVVFINTFSYEYVGIQAYLAFKY